VFKAKIFKDPELSIPQSTIRIPQSSSRHIALQIDRFTFIHMSSFLPNHRDASTSVEIIILVLSAVIDQKVLFLIDKLQNIPLARLEMRGQLDGKRRARLLTEAAVDTAGKVDSKPSGIAASVLTLG
jgi:hypothetical protein